MSAGNTVMLTGNLTADPELRFTTSGVAVVNVRLAVNRRVKEGDGWKDQHSGYFTCNAWRDMAENVAESLHRGDRVVVIGRLVSRSYDDREGQTKWVTEVEAEEICPSLKWARTSITKAGRNTSGGGGSTRPAAPAQAPPSPDDVPF
jgi:single-strand DNA-binding protein